MMQEIADELGLLVDEVISTLAHTDVSGWEERPAPGKWSKKEILGHLTDSAENNIQRFVRATYEDDVKISYQQDAWVAAQHHQQTPTHELIGLWQGLNRQIVRVLRHFPDARLHAQCDVGQEAPEFHPIEFIAGDYVRHMRHHLRQLGLEPVAP